ncbi:MAG: hypothetical protein V2A74_08745 [bacterium]
MGIIACSRFMWTILRRSRWSRGEKRENAIINAIGPETFTYRSLVEQIGEIIGKTRPIVSISPAMGYLMGSVVGRIVNDVLITREEIEGLMADLLHVDAPAAGTTRLTEWAKLNRDSVGHKYASELARRRDRNTGYASN